jgi:tetratricopeptide (TPR) repeat protein
MTQPQSSDAKEIRVDQRVEHSRIKNMIGVVMGNVTFNEIDALTKFAVFFTPALIIVLAATAWWFYDRPTLAFEPAKDGEMLVVLASFSGGSKDAEFNPLRILREPIQSRLERMGMQQDEKIRLEEWVEPVSTARQARELGEKYNATLVIWGEFDDVIGVRTYVEILKDVPQPYAQQAGSLLPVTSPVASVEEATEIGRVPIDCLLNDLPHQGEYLTTLSMGILQLTNYDFSIASEQFSQSLQAVTATAGGQCAISPQYAYYWRGLSYSLQENYPRALADFNQALLIQPEFLFALVQRGNANLAMGNPAVSLQDYQTALTLLYPEDERGRAALLGNMGLTHELLGQHDLAENHYREALKIDEAHRDPEALALDWLHLGNLALRKNDLALADENLKRSLEYYGEAENPSGQAVVLGNLGIIEYQQNDYVGALRLFQEALSKSQDADDKNGQARQLVRISQVYLKQQNAETSQQSLEQALALSQQTGSLYGQAMAHVGLGLTANQRQDMAQARSHLEEAFRLLQGIHSPDARTVQDVLDQLK